MKRIGTKTVCLIFLILLGVYKDLKSYKISNLIITIGIPAGFAFQIYECGRQGIISSLFGSFLPILLLCILFLFKVLGAGDIKLFSVVGSFYGASFVFRTIIIAFLLGGFLSIIHLIKSKQVIYRLQILAEYIQTYRNQANCPDEKGKKRFVIPYYDIQRDGYGGTIHFSIAILGALVIQILMVSGYL